MGWFGRLVRYVRFSMSSYNFERDHMAKNIQLAAGSATLLAGVVVVSMPSTREFLTPWGCGAVILVGVFLLLTADDGVLSKGQMAIIDRPPNSLSQARAIGEYSSFAIEIEDLGEANQFVMYSPSANESLMVSQMHASMNPKPFELDRDIRRLAPLILDSVRSPRNARLFSRQIRLVSDITDRTAADGDKVKLQPADYLSGVCTNDMAMKSATLRSNDDTVLDGMSLVLEDRMVIPLSESRCANIIGIHSLVFFSDGHMMVREQTKEYAHNFGTLVPSVSSTLSMSDYSPALSLQQMVSKAVAGRVCEELAYGRPELVHTSVVGYARMLNRGGKPEFFAVTSVSEPLASVLSPETVKKMSIRMPYRFVAPSAESVAGALAVLSSLRSEHLGEMSALLYANSSFLDSALRNEKTRVALARSLGWQA